MLDYKEQWLAHGRFPFTPSVSDVFGVEAACDQLLEEGLDASIMRHERAARICRTGIKAMGLKLWACREAIASPTVTAIALPDGLTDVEVRRHARERYGVMLSGSQGAGNLIRIGHMGPSTRSLYPIVGLLALGRTCADLGVPVQIGVGIEAAMDALASEQPVGA